MEEHRPFHHKFEHERPFPGHHFEIEEEERPRHRFHDMEEFEHVSSVLLRNSSSLTNALETPPPPQVLQQGAQAFPWR